MTDDADSPDPGLRDVLDALAVATPDNATARFDQLLAHLVATGRLDPAAAGEVKWWQRQSVRAVGDHLARVAPVTIANVVASRAAAADAVAAAARAWAQAVDATDFEPPTPPSTPQPSDRNEFVDRSEVTDARDDEGVSAAHVPSDAPTDVLHDPIESDASQDVIDLRSAREDASFRHEWAGVASPQRHPDSLRSPQRRLLVTGLAIVPGRPAPG